MSLSLPIRFVGQLYYRYRELLGIMFPNLKQRKFTRIDDFYELFICCKTYEKMLANCSMKLILCQKLMRLGSCSFRQMKEHEYFLAMINRIYRTINPIPNSDCLVQRLIATHSFNRFWVNSIKFHEIYPIMVSGYSSCDIWRIEGNKTFGIVSSIKTELRLSYNSVAFHPKKAILVTGSSSGIVLLVECNIDGTNPQILHTIAINKGVIWSIVFHPKLPIVYVSSDYGYLMVLEFSPDFRTLLSETLLQPHRQTINGIAIERNGRFLATCSDDGTIKISTFGSADCKQLRTFETIRTHSNNLCVTIHPQGNLVATGSDDQYARIYRINPNFTITFIISINHRSGVRCVQFDPFNWTLITGCYDGNVRIWDFEGKLLYIFCGNASFSSVLSIGFSPNRPSILAIGHTEEMRIVELKKSEKSKN